MKKFTNVFKRKAIAHNFYIVLKGEVCVLLPKTKGSLTKLYQDFTFADKKTEK